MIRRPPRSTLSSSSAASDVYKRQLLDDAVVAPGEPLTTRVTVAAVHPPGGDVGEDSLTLLTFAAVQDGVVVGLGLGTVNPGSTQGLSGRSGVTGLATIDLATCGEDGEAVSPLDVGGYQLYAGLTASFAGSGGEQRMLLGGPAGSSVGG